MYVWVGVRRCTASRGILESMFWSVCTSIPPQDGPPLSNTLKLTHHADKPLNEKTQRLRFRVEGLGSKFANSPEGLWG